MRNMADPARISALLPSRSSCVESPANSWANPPAATLARSANATSSLSSPAAWARPSASGPTRASSGPKSTLRNRSSAAPATSARSANSGGAGHDGAGVGQVVHRPELAPDHREGTLGRYGEGSRQERAVPKCASASCRRATPCSERRVATDAPARSSSSVAPPARAEKPAATRVTVATTNPAATARRRTRPRRLEAKAAAEGRGGSARGSSGVASGSPSPDLSEAL